MIPTAGLSFRERGVGLVLALVCALAPAQGKGDGKKDKKKSEPVKAKVVAAPFRPFVGRLAAARVRAKERNVPIVVHVILEAEEQNDEHREQVLKDVELQKASAECLVLVANGGRHAPKTIEEVVDGQKARRDVCSVYPWFANCGEHNLAWDELYAEFKETTGEMRCPQMVFLLPDGSVSARINTGGPPPASDVISAILETRAKCGPGLSEEALIEVHKKVTEGEALLGQKAFVEAWKSYARVLVLEAKGQYADQARPLQQKALEGMTAEFEAISARLVPGTAADAFQKLSLFAKGTLGTPLEKPVLERLKKVETDKALRPEIAAWKLSVEADDLLRQARESLDANQEKKAQAIVRRLLAKKYAGTPAQDAARKFWPEIAAEEDAKTPPK